MGHGGRYRGKQKGQVGGKKIFVSSVGRSPDLQMPKEHFATRAMKLLNNIKTTEPGAEGIRNASKRWLRRLIADQGNEFRTKRAELLKYRPLTGFGRTDLERLKQLEIDETRLEIVKAFSEGKDAASHEVQALVEKVNRLTNELNGR